jgi:hypothetical protein
VASLGETFVTKSYTKGKKMARKSGIGDLWKYDPAYIMAEASKKIADKVVKKGPKAVKKVTRKPINMLDPAVGIGSLVKEMRSGKKQSSSTKKKRTPVPLTKKPAVSRNGKKPVPLTKKPSTSRNNMKPVPLTKKPAVKRGKR